MVMKPNMGMPDGEFMDTALAETRDVFEEHCTIRRFTGESAGDGAAGVAPDKTYAEIQDTMLMEELSSQEIGGPGGQYVAGDIRGTFRIEVFGAEGGASNGAVNGDNQAAGRYSDEIVFRGRVYRIVGHPDRIHYGGQYYWKTVLRPNRP